MSATLHRLLASLTAVVAALAVAPVAAADGWLPHPADATWTYEWTDTVYNTTPTKEKVTVKEQKGDQFTLSWTTLEQGNDPAAPVSLGLIAFQETASGPVNTDWQSNPPPATFPILCAAPTQCNNSLSSTYYQLIWGTRAPVLAAPLLTGTQWSTTGGAQGDVSSVSDYVGVENVTVPAFPNPVRAVKVRSEITQAGRMDLLTVVMHELGHVLGLDHDATGGVMGETLAPGSVYRLAGPGLALTTSPRIAANAPARSGIVGGFHLGSAWLFAPQTRVIRHAASRPVLRPVPRGRPVHRKQKPALTLLA